jgi:type III restriction enzyme
VDLASRPSSASSACRRVFDLSATPFFLRGSGYAEGTLFPWTMCDFSLMDAIECGIVKLPRVPVADNITGADAPKFRNLWEHIGKRMPKKGVRTAGKLDPLCQPSCTPRWRRCTATTPRSSTAGRRRASRCPRCSSWCATTRPHRSWSMTTSRASSAPTRQAAPTLENGRLKLFRNYDDNGQKLARPRTLLIDSEQLESGEALDPGFRDIEADTIERFRREIMERTGDPPRPTSLLTPTVARGDEHRGQAWQLGEGIRCVVSVSMLTEGWDANTVTHVLGVTRFRHAAAVRAGGGPALRRQSYELNEEGLFNVEYADVFGIPFNFTAKPTA